ncbi:MAG: transporter substrate-binding domain-containing protein [Chloroflexi bacterium]|nr:transporter substrate-binding domain-containing protein [Chloroflexota bacterium]
MSGHAPAETSSGEAARGGRSPRGVTSSAAGWLAATAILALALLSAAPLACTGSAGDLRIGTDGNYPPFNFLDESGEVTGFERELGDELCRRADLDCVWVITDWEGLIPSLVEGEIDAILAGMSITEERDRVIDFAGPYLPPAPSVYLAPAGSGDDVIDGTVAAQAATVHSDYLAEAGAEFREYDSPAGLLEAVLGGEADAALVDLGFARESIAASAGALAVVGPSVTLDRGIGLGLREGAGELRERIEQALASMREDGSLNRLIFEWFGPDAELF